MGRLKTLEKRAAWAFLGVAGEGVASQVGDARQRELSGKADAVRKRFLCLVWCVFFGAKADGLVLWVVFKWCFLLVCFHFFDSETTWKGNQNETELDEMKTQIRKERASNL